jgi:hypothetical protein
MALPLRAEHSVRVFYLGGRCRWIRLFLGNHGGSEASLQRSVQQRLSCGDAFNRKRLNILPYIFRFSTARKKE